MRSCRPPRVLAMKTPEEIWRDIPGYEGLYQVSNRGNVYSFPRNGTNGGVLAKCTMRGEWTTAHLCRGNIKRKIHIHKLVMITFVGPRPNGMQINHKNGIKTDNRIENLEYCTPRQNIAHAVRNGLWPCQVGKNNGNSKLTDEKVLAIFRAKGFQWQIGEEFGVCQQLVSLIKRKKIWAHLHAA